ncbi:HAD family hydrolase [bacterium]|nr:HAD family hydrolase [bacterium]
MLHTLIFDFDGTLADCKRLHQEAFRSAATELCPGISYTDELLEGRPTVDKMQILRQQGWNFDPVKLNQLKQTRTQEELNNYIVYDPELNQLMTELSHRYQVCLASNATAEFVDRSLNILGIKDLFQVMCTASTHPPKPSTAMFQACMDYTGSEPATTMIFEDSPMGIACAYASGAQVTEVNGAEHTKQEMRRLL